MAALYGRDKKTTYTLGGILGRGGEGEVYEIVGIPNMVAKIYSDKKFQNPKQNQDLRSYQREKIETMIDQPVSPYVNGVLMVAWPQDLLLDSNDTFVGFVMPRVDGKHHIYAASRERERKMLYPKYTWRTAITIAYNLALSVKLIHASGAVIGDLNPNNIMIDEKGHVTLIDTDSFNIKSKKTGKTYKCTVGVPEVLPPELQGRNLCDTNTLFNKKTDSFALSIHIFNLLMNNCHPFGCIGLNNSQASSSVNPVVSNIVKGNCPYVCNKKGTTSPDAPDFKMLPKDIRNLFERSFDYNTSTAVKAETIRKRPEAYEWQDALGNLYQSNLKVCKKEAGQLHLYPNGYNKCPWCAIRKNKKSTQNTVRKLQTSNNVKCNNSSGSAKVPNSSVGSISKQRSCLPFFLANMVVGAILSVLMIDIVGPVFSEQFDINLTYETAQIVLLLLGCISGYRVARFFKQSYLKSTSVWPWYFVALLSPLGTILMIIIIIVFIYIIIFVLSVIWIIIAIAIVMAFFSSVLGI